MNRSIVSLITIAICLAVVPVWGSTIHQAAAKGDILLVKSLIKNDPKLVTEQDERSVTPLHMACFYGRQPVVRYLLSINAPVNAQTKSGYTPLHWAVWQKHKNVVKYLLIKGADVNSRAGNGITPLHFAVQNRDKAIVELLLSSGADARLADSNGQTPAQLAKNLEATQLYALFPELETEKTVAKEVNKPMFRHFPKIALNAASNTKAPVKTGTTPAKNDDKPDQKISNVVKATDPASHRPISKKPVLLTRSDIHAIIAAAKIKKLEALRYLHNNRPDLLNARDANGATVIHWLAEEDWAEGIQLMSELGYDINAQKKDGVTPLHVAAAMGKLNALDALLGCGAKLDTPDLKGRTPESLARERNQRDALGVIKNTH